MRALAVARRKTPPSMELMPTLVDGFNQWRNQYRDKMEYFSFFAGGNGGSGIANEMELYEIISAWPLTPFSDMQVEVLVDGDEALKAMTETVKVRAEHMA